MLRESWREWISNDEPRVGPPGMHLMWTFLFCAALALGFTVLGFSYNARRVSDWLSLSNWGYWYSLNLGVTLVIGYLVHGLFSLAAAWLGYARIRRFSGVPRTLYFTGIPLVGVALGWPLGVWLVTRKAPDLLAYMQRPSVILGSVALAVMITIALHLFFQAKARQVHAEKEAAEAQLRLLQGQIEPHFLFNTLANVQALIDQDPAKAKNMLDAFTDYLRGSLQGLRHSESTLEAEFAMIGSYLLLLKTRMEDRLSYELELAPELRGARLPPLLLQPLVENAIQHGLEPKIEGGRVRVTACRDGAQLRIEVHDDGLGPDPAAQGRKGAGLALANLRQRLQAQYGRHASLELIAAQPGTLVRLQLPLDMETAA